MKARVIVVIMCAAQLLIGASTTVKAQGFKEVMAMLNKLDSRVGSLETKSNTDISTLKNQISNIPPNMDAAEVEESLAQLQERTDQLSNDLQEVKSNNNNDQLVVLNSLVAELRALTEKLRQSVNDSVQTDVQTLPEITMTEPRATDTDNGSDIEAPFSGDLNGEATSSEDSNGDPASSEAAVSSEPVVSEESLEAAPQLFNPQILPDALGLPGIEISGFGDFFNSPGRSSALGFGQVEVDLETTVADKVVVGAAIAYDDGSFGLGAFTVDFPIFGSDENHFSTVSWIDHAGIMAGQFDVPFGLDWQVYPSIDRKLVSVPLAVENSHDCWNDYGVQVYAEHSMFNAVVYGTNGFGYESFEDEPVEVEMKSSVGGRLGFKPHETLEIGGSYAEFHDQDKNRDMALIGADVQFSLNSFSFKGEYIEHSMALQQASSLTNRGFYGQGMYDFGKFFMVARYGMYSFGVAGEEDLKRLSLGAGWAIKEGCEIRYEYQSNFGQIEDSGFLQLVVGF